MPKILCITGMIISILVFLLFVFDLAAPAWMAPFKKSSMLFDIIFIVAACMLGYMSWSTYREQD